MPSGNWRCPSASLRRIWTGMPSELSMGDLRKLELARTLATGAEILLLDEVFAGPHGWRNRTDHRASASAARGGHDLRHRLARSEGAGAAGRSGRRHGARRTAIAEGTFADVIAHEEVRASYSGRCRVRRASGDRRPFGLLRARAGTARRVAVRRRGRDRRRHRCTNGAGKSTLLDSIMGMTRTTGTIRLVDTARNWVGHSTGRGIVRAGIGYAPERANLFPYMSVRDNLLVGAYTARDDIEPEPGPCPRPVSAPSQGAQPARKPRPNRVESVRWSRSAGR